MESMGLSSAALSESRCGLIVYQYHLMPSTREKTVSYLKTGSAPAKAAGSARRPAPTFDITSRDTAGAPASGHSSPSVQTGFCEPQLLVCSRENPGAGRFQPDAIIGSAQETVAGPTQQTAIFSDQPTPAQRSILPRSWNYGADLKVLRRRGQADVRASSSLSSV